jgi:hypothetical protein
VDGLSGYLTAATTATLLPGQEFNQVIKRLAGTTNASYNTMDIAISEIVQWT